MKLATDLEHAVMAAMVEGLMPSDSVTVSELSKPGQSFLRAVQYLRDRGEIGPLDHGIVAMTAAELFGLSSDDARKYRRAIDNAAKKGAAVLLRAVRERLALTSLINEASRQLASGRVSLQQLRSILVVEREVGFKPVSELVKDRWPDPPKGIEIPSLPKLTKETGGLFGLWVVGGEPGLGKSTLAWQIALDVNVPCIYYDLDGTGEGWVLHRTRQIVRGNIETFKKLTEKLYYRDSIRSLDADLGHLKPPALIVIDSAQTLPIRLNDRRASLDGWLIRLKEIARDGYAVLCVSEKSRAAYGEASLRGFKETGSFEYAGPVCVQLVGDLDDPDPYKMIDVVLVKNRHEPAGGLIATIQRDKSGWWFHERNGHEDEDEEFID